MISVKVPLLVLLLAWHALAIPASTKAKSRWLPTAESEMNVDAAVASTKDILNRVSAFLKKLSDLTESKDHLTPQRASILLPEFVQEAVRLRSELNLNPVKYEDPEAVDRVKDMVTQALHSFAQNYDRSEDTTLPIFDLWFPENATEAIPEDTTPGVDPETAIILASDENETRKQQSDDSLDQDITPAGTRKLRPLTVPFLGHPFANTKAFSFTNPVTNYVQEFEPVFKWLPGGGYHLYLYYTQG